jgi:hypothetical protein
MTTPRILVALTGLAPVAGGIAAIFDLRKAILGIDRLPADEFDKAPLANTWKGSIEAQNIPIHKLERGARSTCAAMAISPLRPAHGPRQ